MMWKKETRIVLILSRGPEWENNYFVQLLIGKATLLLMLWDRVELCQPLGVATLKLVKLCSKPVEKIIQYHR